MSRPDWLPTSSVDVNVHLFETSTLRPLLYLDDQRATVRVEGTGGSTTLYAERDGLARLRDVLTDVVARLDAARQHPAA
ncbi:MAG: hypothetical protein EKK42_13855 [Pseudonocardiaceae bacterium]|nr:MAG: hypothetical protein EKK42_13855 [Pseudonocardiaceae bacterium]